MSERNLKQMGLGFLQYVQDYDEQGPITADWYGNEEFYIFPAKLQPYMKNFGIARCPDSTYREGTAQYLAAGKIRGECYIDAAGSSHVS